MSQFQQPGISDPGEKFVPSESNGALLLFFPTQIHVQVKTAHGERDAITARVVRLNDGRIWDDAMIFSTALVTQLKGAVPDGMVLGTLGQGENTKGNPPWLLRPHTEADVATAEQWLSANPRNQFAQPQTQATPPTPPAYGQQGTGGWGQQAAPAPSAPQATAGGWGSPPAQQATPAWGAPAPAVPVPDSSPGAGSVDPQLVAALATKGVNLPPGTTQQSAEAIWAMVSAQ